MSKLLDKKVALITGAAAGIGQETASLFAEHGAKLILTDVNEAKLNETAAAIRQKGADVITFKHDVSDEAQWSNVAKKGADHFGSIDILFNNAGIYIIAPITEITLDNWNKLMGINVTGTFLGIKHTVPFMKSGAAIINASSVAGLRGATGHLLYGASKGAVRALTEDAAAELAPKNIRVNSIHPSYVKTEMADYAAKKGGGTLKDLAKPIPLGRLCEISEIAKSVLFLASDQSSYITGHALVIDGGLTTCVGL